MLAWLWALLGVASAQDDPQVAHTGAEWWAAGGLGTLLAGGGGTVVVKKALALLALESKVEANAAALSGLSDSIKAQNEAISTLREAISKLDGRIDGMSDTLVRVETSVASTVSSTGDAQKHREEFVELRANVKHIADRFAATDVAVREVRALIVEAARRD